MKLYLSNKFNLNLNPNIDNLYVYIYIYITEISISPDLAYVRSSIDTLASTGLPIWITELGIASAFGQQVIKMLKRQKYGTFLFFKISFVV